MMACIVLLGVGGLVRCGRTQILRLRKVARHGRRIVGGTRELAPMNPWSTRKETLTELQALSHAIGPEG